MDANKDQGPVYGPNMAGIAQSSSVISSITFRTCDTIDLHTTIVIVVPGYFYDIQLILNNDVFLHKSTVFVSAKKPQR